MQHGAAAQAEPCVFIFWLTQLVGYVGPAYPPVGPRGLIVEQKVAGTEPESHCGNCSVAGCSNDQCWQAGASHAASLSSLHTMKRIYSIYLTILDGQQMGKPCRHY